MMFPILDATIQLTMPDDSTVQFNLEAPNAEDPFEFGFRKVPILGNYPDADRKTQRGHYIYEFIGRYRYESHEMDLRELLVARQITLKFPPPFSDDTTSYQSVTVFLSNDQVVKNYLAGLAMASESGSIVPSGSVTLEFIGTQPFSDTDIFDFIFFQPIPPVPPSVVLPVFYDDISLRTGRQTAGESAIETVGFLWFPGLGKLAGDDSERGIIKISKETGLSVGGVFSTPIITEEGSHFAPSAYGESETVVAVVMAWWGGATVGSGLRRDYVQLEIDIISEESIGGLASFQVGFDNLSPAPDPWTVTCTYPSIIVTSGKTMIMCRLPTTSIARDWGYRFADRLPGSLDSVNNFSQERRLIEADGDNPYWFYFRFKVDTVNSNIVHFMSRDNSGPNKTDGAVYYFYMDFNSEKAFGVSGEIDDIVYDMGTRDSLLGNTVGAMWEVYTPSDWAFPGMPFTTGAPGSGSPVYIPFIERVTGGPPGFTGQATYELKIAKLSEAAGEFVNGFEIIDPEIDGINAVGPVEGDALGGSGAIATYQGEDRWDIIYWKNDNIYRLSTTDGFDTFEEVLIDEYRPNLKWLIDVVGANDYPAVMLDGQVPSDSDWLVALRDVQVDPEPVVVPYKSMLMNGTDQYVNLTTLGAFAQSLANCTIEFWVKTAIDDERMSLASTFNDGATTALSCLLNVRTNAALENDSFYTQIRNDSGTSRVVANNSVTGFVNNMWHKVVFVWEDGDAGIWLDGNLWNFVATGTPPTNNFSNFAYPLLLGGYNNRGTINQLFYQGKIAFPAFFTRTKTVKELTLRWKNLPDTDDPDLFAAWFFSEGSGDSVQDSSGNGFTGSLVGNVADNMWDDDIPPLDF